MAIRAVVFDIGGVLEITPSTRWQARWEASLGLDAGAIDTRLEDIYRAGTVGAISREEAEEGIRARLGLDGPQLTKLIADLWHEYLGTLDPVLTRWFGALRPRYRTGMLSNSWVGAREMEAARHGFGQLCDVIVYSHEEGLVKPAPRFYEIICQRLGVLPEETIFLDDAKANVSAARALGMLAVQHRGDTGETIAELEALLRRDLQR